MTLRDDPGLWLLLHLRPPRDRRGDRRGACTVCGAETRFVRNSWVIPEELARERPVEFVDRESQMCSRCGANGRARGIASVLLEHYGDRARSGAELVREDRFRSLD